MSSSLPQFIISGLLLHTPLSTEKSNITLCRGLECSGRQRQILAAALRPIMHRSRVLPILWSMGPKTPEHTISSSSFFLFKRKSGSKHCFLFSLPPHLFFWIVFIYHHLSFILSSLSAKRHHQLHMHCVNDPADCRDKRVGCKVWKLLSDSHDNWNSIWTWIDSCISMFLRSRFLKVTWYTTRFTEVIAKPNVFGTNKFNNLRSSDLPFGHYWQV